MSLHLHNTLSKAKEAFVPIDPARVTMYVCGPTVYNYAHIGNARPPVVFDVLFRVLRRIYGENHVLYARNFTDVDDKIIERAAQTGEPMAAITEKFAQIYREDTAALGVLPPTFEPLATGHIGDMIDLVARLVDAGHAYAAEGHVLFSVSSFERYGQLSKRSVEDMRAGARVEVAPYKKDPGDFVLWKPSEPDVVGWDSPWGRGRPGWHLECSAMIEKTLGETIDIHGGGQDLQFPHHENEIAQSACAHGGAPLANIWMHNGFLTMDAEKMSKSLGNVKLVHHLLDHWPGEVLRFALLSAHYRQPLDWTDALLNQAKATLDGWYGALRRLADVDAPLGDGAVPGDVLDALEDDLNTPGAFAAMSALATAANKAQTPAEKAKAKADLLSAGEILGLLQGDPDAWFQGEASEGGLSGEAIDTMLVDRANARKAKDFTTADRIRDELTAAGIVIEDSPTGATWRRG